MKRILVSTGIDGNASHLHRLLREADDRKAEALLFAGGILRPGMAPDDRAAFLVSFFEALGGRPRFTVLIPGPEDGPKPEFLRAALNAENTFRDLFVAHGTPIPHGDTVVAGLGGELSEAEESDGPPIRYARVTAQYLLRSLLYADKPTKVLLLSAVPPGPLAGGTGNPIAAELIHGLHPTLCIVAGDRAHRGTQILGDTLVVNPGRVSQGSAAWIERIPGDVELVDL